MKAKLIFSIRVFSNEMSLVSIIFFGQYSSLAVFSQSVPLTSAQVTESSLRVYVRVITFDCLALFADSATIKALFG